MFPIRKIMNGTDGIAERLALVHAHVKTLDECAGISRIAFAAYNADTGIINTYALSDDGDDGLSLYATALDDAPSLKRLAEEDEFRIVDDLCADYPETHAHARVICSVGLRSSLTFPVFSGEVLQGFLFFNAPAKGAFTARVVERLGPYVALISLMMINEMAPLKSLQAAVDTVRDISVHRDDETGAHLLRMSAYVRLIALELARRHGYPDDWVDMLVRCAPLHDVGKVAVPDHILHKPGKLDPEERAVMQGHVRSGIDIALTILKNFRLNRAHVGTMLHDLIAQHHETLDGTGYPNQLNDGAISIEARIVAVADIFDALTNERVYKAAWPVEKAIDYMKSLADVKLDEECVAIMAANLAQIADIQARYR